MSKRKQKAASHKGGKIGGHIAGTKQVEQGIAMFSPEYDAQAAAKQNVLKRGHFPYVYKR